MALSHLTSADFDQAVNAGEEMDLASRFGVMSVPTLLYFKRGEIVNKTVGLISPADLENAIAKSK